MKKKFFSSLAIAAFVGAIGFNFSKSTLVSNLTSLTNANIYANAYDWEEFCQDVGIKGHGTQYKCPTMYTSSVTSHKIYINAGAAAEMKKMGLNVYAETGGRYYYYGTVTTYKHETPKWGTHCEYGGFTCTEVSC